MYSLQIQKYKTVSNLTSLEECSKLYQNIRDRSNLGASSFADGNVLCDGKIVARISYNGRIWSPEPYGDKNCKLISEAA